MPALPARGRVFCPAPGNSGLPAAKQLLRARARQQEHQLRRIQFVMLDMSVRAKTALMTTGKNAVIAGGTGIATHQTPIHRTVPRASRTFCVRPP